MTTAAQTQANQANAQASTGPRTAAGKAISSRNSTSHGLTAKTVLLQGEDPAEYDVLAAGMLQDFNPLDTVEASLALELVDLQWRLRRIPGLEARLLDAATPDFKALNNISLHAARMKRQFSATLKEFQQLHQTNSDDWNKRLEQALTLQEADQLLARPSTLVRNGFDFTPQYLKSILDRRKALQEAKDEIAEDKFAAYDNDLASFDNEEEAAA